MKPCLLREGFAVASELPGAEAELLGELLLRPGRVLDPQCLGLPPELPRPVVLRERAPAAAGAPRGPARGAAAGPPRGAARGGCPPRPCSERRRSPARAGRRRRARPPGRSRPRRAS